MITYNDDEITPERFDLWLRHARPGDKMEYHRGFLAIDREKVMVLPRFGGTAHVYFEPMHSVGVAAWIAYEQGRVVLAQKRIAPGVYSYIAFKRKKAMKTTKRRLA